MTSSVILKAAVLRACIMFTRVHAVKEENIAAHNYIHCHKRKWMESRFGCYMTERAKSDVSNQQSNINFTLAFPLAFSV